MQTFLQVRVDVIHLTFNDNPAVVFSVVFLHLLHGDVSDIFLRRGGDDGRFVGGVILLRNFYFLRVYDRHLHF